MISTLLTVLGLYYAVTLIISFWKFRSQTKAEYVSAPNSTGAVVLTLSLLGTIVGGGMFLGIAQLGYSGGLTAFALGVAYLIGSIILGLLSPILRTTCANRGVTTLVGLFESLYPPTNRFPVSTLFVWTTFLVFLLMLAVQFLSIATFIRYYIGIQFNEAIMIGAGVIATISTLIYTSFGGFTRDMWSDVIQVALITIGILVILIAETSTPGLQSQISKLPPEFFTIKSDGIVFFVGALFFVAPTFLVRFDLWQRIITARTDAVARRAFISSGLFAFLFFAFFGLLGMYGRAIGLVNEEFVALEVIQHKMTGLNHSIAIAAFFAAVMSTADTFLGVTGLALAKGSIYRTVGSLDNNPNDISFVRTLRRLTFLVGVFSIVVAYAMRDIIDTFAVAFGLLMVFLPALIGGLLTDKPKEAAARWSIILGLVALFTHGLLIGAKTAFLPGCIVAVGSYLFLASRHKRTAVTRQ